uniref:Uncharacterized protein n=1 Tax=Pyxicephalus adspersus TaxID=30357 RepID=A0AAV2ZUH8_PYXAD|nr:TPA: hypothetical protein GDO54_004524 [Pyxicephalus adspersus]
MGQNPGNLITCLKFFDQHLLCHTPQATITLYNLRFLCVMVVGRTWPWIKENQASKKVNLCDSEDASLDNIGKTGLLQSAHRQGF